MTEVLPRKIFTTVSLGVMSDMILEKRRENDHR